MRAGLGAAAAAAIFGSAVLGGVAAAAVHVPPTVDPEALVDARGRTVEVRGTVDCDLGDRVLVIVTLDQGAAHASGNNRVRCDETTQSWSVTVRTKGNELGFQQGPAEAHVQATIPRTTWSETNPYVAIDLVQAP